MKTHSQYMDKEVTHHEYFSQFVTPSVLSRVRSGIGVERIKASTCEHFNDIPLRLWDALHLVVFPGGGMNCGRLPGDALRLMREAGEGHSVASGNCVCKAAARMIKEGQS